MSDSPDPARIAAIAEGLSEKGRAALVLLHEQGGSYT